MHIVSARIKGFRNLQENTFEFSPRVNLVLGRNGEGKTNFLEALNYFSLGRSHRGGKSDEIIGFDEEALHVDLEIEEEPGAHVKCEYGLDRRGQSRFKVDGETLPRRADLVGRLATVFFNPESIRLVRSGPVHRRHFVDRGMAEIDPVYLGHLTAFQRVLRQKTGLLRDLKKGPRDLGRARAEVTAWNRELAQHAAVIAAGRREYAARLNPFANAVHKHLVNNGLQMDFSYAPQLACLAAKTGEDPEKPWSERDLEADIFEEIDYIWESEMRRGRPLRGPQFDDFVVRLGDLDLRVFGSQGEKRTAAIALILARSDLLHDRRRIRPVLFFDDIFSELDRERTLRLQELATRNHQVFIATARQDDVAGWSPEGMKAWRVEAGVLSEDSD